MALSYGAAMIADAAWSGPKTEGAANASFDVTALSDLNFFHLAIQEYSDIINAADPDLSPFRKAAGKLYHADESIPTKGTGFYYDSIRDRSPDALDFYRFFKSPDLTHCSGGKGGQPTTIFDALRGWVENGTCSGYFACGVYGDEWDKASTDSVSLSQPG
ncbi:tannase and feruloyl esterase-domain-containing protein [Aspergillus floccosus]